MILTDLQFDLSMATGLLLEIRALVAAPRETEETCPPPSSQESAKLSKTNGMKLTGSTFWYSAKSARL